ncbi:uncharacterized protein LOC127854107 isoform X3 [Dreissena polymorpha]|uniref:uncharacterized protein LOC127854107 isoform X3 n=1 Tax=Dreissena polymorpha TaxID=45954 RepID=UPI002263C391|nr:uncharacterized protein LOC127854107 isoform X3 [Dreissena polymorpha]
MPSFLHTGGPRTKKGRKLDNLANAFDMEVVNVENCILQTLAKKVENPDQDNIVMMVQELLKSQDGLLRLDGVLRMVSKAISQCNQNKIILVDLMPNLTWMLRNKNFIKECSLEFTNFQDQYPISFVLNFMITKEKLEAQAAKQTTAEQASKTAQQKNAKKIESPKQSDEADSSRTQKRILLYEESIKHFMEYFETRNKIVSIDVSSGAEDAIWAKLCEFFSKFDCQSRRIVESVIIFGFGERELSEIDMSRYNVTNVKLKDFIKEGSSSPEEIIMELCHCIDDSAPPKRVFAVDLSDTGISKDLPKSKSIKQIQFTEAGDQCKMSRYCSRNISVKGDSMTLQAVASVNNEVCLFTKSVPHDLCKWIAQTLFEGRNKKQRS